MYTYIILFIKNKNIIQVNPQQYTTYVLREKVTSTPSMHDSGFLTSCKKDPSFENNLK